MWPPNHYGPGPFTNSNYEVSPNNPLSYNPYPGQNSYYPEYPIITQNQQINYNNSNNGYNQDLYNTNFTQPNQYTSTSPYVPHNYDNGSGLTHSNHFVHNPSNEYTSYNQSSSNSYQGNGYYVNGTVPNQYLSQTSYPDPNHSTLQTNQPFNELIHENQYNSNDIPRVSTLTSSRPKDEALNVQNDFFMQQILNDRVSQVESTNSPESSNVEPLNVVEDVPPRPVEDKSYVEEFDNVRETLYSCLVEVSKNLTKNTTRISELVTESYVDVVNPTSEEHLFLKDILHYFQETIEEMRNILKEDVSSMSENFQATISSSSQNLLNNAQRLFTFIQSSLIDQTIVMEQTELLDKLKHSTTALLFSIKELVAELDNLKVGIEAHQVSHTNKNKDTQLHKQYDSTQYDLSSIPEDKIKLLQSTIRTWTLGRKFRAIVLHYKTSQEDDVVRHRGKALIEIRDTEKSYVESLEECSQNFYLPLKKTSENSSWLTLSDVEALFNNYSMIIEFSKKLLFDFEERVKRWPINQLFGDILIDHSKDMIVYADYVNGFDCALQVYNRLKLNLDFQALERKCIESCKRRMDLQSYLIMPVQRVPRYQLLIKELLKLTSKDHIDYNNLNEALDTITKLNVEINRRKREYDNKIKIMQLSSSITSDKPIELLKEGRNFISEALPTVTTQMSKYQGRVCLFNDILLILRQEKKPQMTFFYEGTIQLDELGMVEIKKNKKSCTIWDKSGKKSFECTLSFSNEKELLKWQKEITSAVETFSLRAMLDSNMKETPTNRHLVILSAMYGDLSKPKNSIDVTQALQSIVNSSGNLKLPETSKSNLPGFTDPAKGKKKSLMVVYQYNGIVKTKTVVDEAGLSLPE